MKPKIRKCIYLAFSASCCATCFNSTAAENSLAKVRWVMLMSSKISPNCTALEVRSLWTLSLSISIFKFRFPASISATRVV